MSKESDEILAERTAEPRMNGWCSGFSRALAYAEENKVPLIGIWSDGDDCKYCRMLETSLVTETFKSYMKTSGCVFYFGYRADVSNDDKIYGTGYYWCWGPDKKTQQFPLVRICWTDGNTDWIGSGRDLAGELQEEAGAEVIVRKIKNILSNYVPASEADLLPGKGASYYADAVEKALAEIDEAKTEKYQYDESESELAGAKTLFGIGQDCIVRTRDGKTFMFTAADRTYTEILTS